MLTVLLCNGPARLPVARVRLYPGHGAVVSTASLSKISSRAIPTAPRFLSPLTRLGRAGRFSAR